MKLYKYGNPESNIVLIQPVGTHNLNEIPNQVERIKINTKKEIQMLAIKVDNWNQELSPWKAPAVFGKEAFGDGDRKSTRLNSSHVRTSRMPSSA